MRLRNIEHDVASGVPIVFIVGAAISYDRVRGVGVPDVEGVLKLIQREYAGNGFQLRGVTIIEQYQNAFADLTSKISASASDRVVRNAVLQACTLPPNDPALQRTETADCSEQERACARLQQMVQAWALPPGVEVLANAVARAQAAIQRNGNRTQDPVIVTTNFDGLLEIALKRIGVEFKSLSLARDDAVRPDPGWVNIWHVHGYWCNAPTLHTPNALEFDRTALKNALRQVLNKAAVYVMAYGGWNDAVFAVLSEILRDRSGCDMRALLWALHQKDVVEAEAANTHVFKSFESFGGAQFAQFYLGVDVHGAPEDLMHSAEQEPNCFMVTSLLNGGPEGVREWNRLVAREGNRSTICLGELDLSDADLRGVDLHGAKLNGTVLRGANLHGANLSEADLRGSDISEADLTNANLCRADLRGANLQCVALSGSGRRATRLDQETAIKSHWTVSHLAEWRDAGASLDFGLLSQIPPPSVRAPYMPYPVAEVLELQALTLAREDGLGTPRDQDSRQRRIDELVGVLKRSPAGNNEVVACRLVRILGKGNYGTVWQAEDLKTGEPRAVKVFDSDRLGLTTALYHFRRGVRAIERLNGSATRPETIVKLHETEESHLAFSMDYLAECDLSNLNHRGWSLTKKLEVFEQLCGAVRFAHDLKIIHRDIKPANIVMHGGKPVLTDFDMADLLFVKTRSSHAIGSVNYAAPELWSRPRARGAPTADIYSLGRLLTFLILEKEPDPWSEEGLVFAALRGRCDYSRGWIPNLVLKCTKRSPSERYQSVEELLGDVATHGAPGAREPIELALPQHASDTEESDPNPARGESTKHAMIEPNSLLPLAAPKRNISLPPISRRRALVLFASVGSCCAGAAAFKLIEQSPWWRYGPICSPKNKRFLSGTSGAEVTLGSIAKGTSDVPGTAAMLADFKKRHGVIARQNPYGHDHFKAMVDTYLQDCPDDVVAWLAGKRVGPSAIKQLVRLLPKQIRDDIDSRIPQCFQDCLKRLKEQDCIVPFKTYPWAVFYRKSLWKANNYEIPTNWNGLIDLANKMKYEQKVSSPIAFGNVKQWPALGTFDILNMRLHGFAFHRSLMQGSVMWTSREVKRVFEYWEKLIEFYPKHWKDLDYAQGTALLLNQQAGMYFIGGFVVSEIMAAARNDPSSVAAAAQNDLGVFAFPEIEPAWKMDAIDAPIDGYVLPMNAQGGKNAEELIEYLGTAEAFKASDSKNPGFVSIYDLPKEPIEDKKRELTIHEEMVNILSRTKDVACFMDREMDQPEFVEEVVKPKFEEFLSNPKDIDAILRTLEAGRAKYFKA